MSDKLSLYRQFFKLLSKHTAPNFWDRRVLNTPEEAEELARDLEELGPTFVKLGQLMASRADLLPESYMAALARLQDDVAPASTEKLRLVFREEFGKDPEELFAEFDWTPVAAASLGQVHRARLPDGVPVVVKIQRPAVQENFERDLEVVAELAEFLEAFTETGERYRLGALVDDLEKSLRRELDYRIEARNLEHLHALLEPYPNLYAPLPFSEYSGRRVLTMQFVEGTRVDEARIPHKKAKALATQLFDAYLHQILVDGRYHADPHPGNILVSADAEQASIIDLGLIGHVDYQLRHQLVLILLHISEARSDRVASLCLQVAERRGEADEARFRRLIAHQVHSYNEMPLLEMRVGQALLDVCSAAGECGLTVPPQLALLAKTMLQLDQLGKTLAPDFLPNQRLKERLPYLLTHMGLEQFSPSEAAERLYQFKQLIYAAPAQGQRILQDMAEGEFGINLKMHHIPELMEAFEKVANRIAAGMVLGAMLVGAAILMHIPGAQDGGLWGLPNLGAGVFILAVFGGFYLVASVFYYDRLKAPVRSKKIRG